MISSLHSLSFSMSWRVLVEFLSRFFRVPRCSLSQLKGGILLPRDFLRQTAASHDPPTCAINMPCKWQQWDHRFEYCVTSRWNLFQTWPEFFASEVADYHIFGTLPYLKSSGTVENIWRIMTWMITLSRSFNSAERHIFLLPLDGPCDKSKQWSSKCLMCGWFVLYDDHEPWTDSANG